MATRYIVQMRRGSSAQWAESEIIPLAGEIVVEIDEKNTTHKLKIGDGIHAYSELGYLQAGDEVVTQILTKALPHVVTVTLDVNSWIKKDDYYSQSVAIDGITQYSRLDLQPDANMLAELKTLGVSFVTENVNKTITVHSVGNKPTATYTMQATVIETGVEVECDKIVGTPIGVPKTEITKDDLAPDILEILNKIDNQSCNETDPTVPDWAKESSKPSYTASEVGALPDTTFIPDALHDLSEDAAHRTVTDDEKATWNNKIDITILNSELAKIEDDHTAIRSEFAASDITTLTESKSYTDEKIATIPAQTDYTVTITETTDGLENSVAKKYTFVQNGTEIGFINLAKELVVTSGSVKEVVTTNTPYAGATIGDKYIELVIANQTTPIYVPAKDLVDIYTAKNGATEVQVVINSTNEISATLVNGGIAEEKLAEGIKIKLNKVWEEVGVAANLVGVLENGQVNTNKKSIEAINNETTGILTQAKKYADNINTAMDTRVKVLEDKNHTHTNKTVIDGITADKVNVWNSAVLYTVQTLTDAQKAQVRANIGAVDSATIGDIEAALDNILAMQNSLIGG